MTLPTDYDARKALPIFDGVLRYFPLAIAAVAHCSKVGNDQHNPGEPLHWAREKSTDELNTLVRHLIEAGTIDTDGVRHSAKAAWRALAALQKEIEADGGRIHGVAAAPACVPALLSICTDTRCVFCGNVIGGPGHVGPCVRPTFAWSEATPAPAPVPVPAPVPGPAPVRQCLRQLGDADFCGHDLGHAGPCT